MYLSAQFLSSRIDPLLSPLFDAELHQKTLRSLHHGVLGTLHAARAGIPAIGQGLAVALNLERKHAIKQVDRLLSNPHFDPELLAPPWVRFVVGNRTELIVALDCDGCAGIERQCEFHRSHTPPHRGVIA